MLKDELFPHQTRIHKYITGQQDRLTPLHYPHAAHTFYMLRCEFITLDNIEYLMPNDRIFRTFEASYLLFTRQSEHQNVISCKLPLRSVSLLSWRSASSICRSGLQILITMQFSPDLWCNQSIFPSLQTILDIFMKLPLIIRFEPNVCC